MDDKDESVVHHSSLTFAEVRLKPHLASLASFVLAVCGTALAQTLEVNPQRVLSDEPVVIRATSLQPGERVTIKADLEDGAGERWESEAEFVADAQGTVDV